MSKYNKPMDRDYFKRKKNPNWDAKKKLTECCEQPLAHEVLNVQLHDYPNTETITPISCETCGRLLEYSSTLNENTWKPGYLRK